jgi:hypothetical protein
MLSTTKAPLFPTENLAYDPICKHLEDLEQTHNITIQLAVEISSRSSGYNQKNSDYDIFFIFKQNDLNDYLGICGYKDTVSFSVGDFTFSGWNIKKAMSLCVKSNPKIVELVGVAYTQRDKVYKDDLDLKLALSNYILKFDPFTLFKKNIGEAYVRHSDFLKSLKDKDKLKSAKFLISSLRCYSLAKDYATKGLENILVNYSDLSIGIFARTFDNKNDTNFYKLLEDLRFSRFFDMDFSILDRYGKVLDSKISDLNSNTHDLELFFNKTPFDKMQAEANSILLKTLTK